MIKAIYILTPLLAISSGLAAVDTVVPNTDKWEIFDFIIEKGGKEAYRFPEKGAKKENLVIDRGIKYAKFITPDKTQCGVRSVTADPYGFFAVPTIIDTKIGIWTEKDIEAEGVQYQLHTFGTVDEVDKRILSHPKNAGYHKLPYILKNKNTHEAGKFLYYRADSLELIYTPSIAFADYIAPMVIGESKVEIAKQALDRFIEGYGFALLFASRERIGRACKKPPGAPGYSGTIYPAFIDDMCYSRDTILETFMSDADFARKIDTCRQRHTNRYEPY